MKWLFILVLPVLVSCREQPDASNDTYTRIVYRGPLNMDVRAVHLRSWTADLKTSDSTRVITEVIADLYSMKLSVSGAYLNTPAISCSFERALTLSEYQALRTQYESISLCELESTEPLPCSFSGGASPLPSFAPIADIILKSSSGNFKVSSIDIRYSCLAAPTNCSPQDYDDMSELLITLFENDLESCQ